MDCVVEPPWPFCITGKIDLFARALQCQCPGFVRPSVCRNYSVNLDELFSSHTRYASHPPINIKKAGAFEQGGFPFLQNSHIPPEIEGVDVPAQLRSLLDDE